jgi:hypothetical protein
MALVNTLVSSIVSDAKQRMAEVGLNHGSLRIGPCGDPFSYGIWYVKLSHPSDDLDSSPATLRFLHKTQDAFIFVHVVDGGGLRPCLLCPGYAQVLSQDHLRLQQLL